MVTCRTCTDINGDLYIESVVASKTLALPGETIDITVTALNKSAFFYHWMNICLIDRQTGQSQTSSKFELSSTCLFGPCNNVKQIHFNYIMPNKDVSLSVALIEEEADKCEATKTISLYVNTGTGSHRECISNICQDRPGPGDNQCRIAGEACSGDETKCPNCDLSKNACLPVLGCQSKQSITLAVIAFFGFIYLTRK